MKRERLGSRLGFILLSAGCAIGIGNVWKFPYITGQYGGGAFVLIYLFFLLFMGVPVLTMEFSMGRASRKSPVRLYQQLVPEKKAWHIHGYLAMLGNYVLMMFYTTVAGWMLKYFVDMAVGKFESASSDQIVTIFTDMLAEPVTMTVYMAIVVIGSFIVCAVGLQNGLEKITKWMMLALLAIMLLLAVNSIFLPGAAEGLKFYLVPDFEKMKAAGILNVIVAAMNQAFFTLSLGIGAMAIFGSYIDNKRTLMGEAVNVALLDTFVAISSGLIIFPACFAYGVEADSGPSLIFITLPNIFNNMPLGRLWGSLFFVFMSFAAISTVLAVFENIISCTRDLWNMSRVKACVINCIIILVISVPCILGFNLWSGFAPFGEGTNILDLEDFVVSNVLLPLGALLYTIFCVSKSAWGFENFTTEANKGEGLKIKPYMRAYITYILPLIVAAILILGLYNFFK